MDNQRLILALVFGFSLMMLWDAWQKYSQPQPPVVSTVAGQTAAAPVPAGANNVPAASAVPSAPAAAGSAAAPATSAATMTVTTDELVAQISAQGGDFVHLELLHHRATEDKSRNFVIFDSKHAYAAQSGLIGSGLPNHKTVWRLPADSMALKDGESELRVRLTAPAESGVEVTKTYIFHRGGYLVNVEYDIVNAVAGGDFPRGLFPARSRWQGA